MSLLDSSKATLHVDNQTYDYIDIAQFAQIQHLPYALRVLVENLIRKIDGANITDQHV